MPDAPPYGQPVNAVTSEPQATAPVPSTGIMRAQAVWFRDQKAVLRRQAVKRFGADFRRYLEHLIPQVERFADAQPLDDCPARVAAVGVREARRRLDEPVPEGLTAEVARVERLARSVLVLCDHHAALRGQVMCLVCDKPIESGDVWVPYDKVSPSGGATRAGRVHRYCVDVRRRP
ncbi:DUF6415 family natural product biosynthesis protein [Streptomyces sp. NPDC091377]|uniref:DUF6415 family natural product biosynthesis protein n=1 Tax=Streptomyces sp. NPDC091377 TaxID=3365995 RepID=UPI00380B2DC1